MSGERQRTPERWQKIEAFYHSALGIEEGHRAEYLREACAGDESLRREVESLLAQEGGVKGFLEAPALEAAARMFNEAQGESLIGRQVGSYQVLSLLGVGGMGEVYLALDSKLRRDVAIKVLPTTFVHNSERLARFQREARMLASLNHPNIATIYGLEHSEGVHYLAMELVPGQTLAERVSGGPVPIKEALAIAGQIAEALEAAHEKGVIHRDLKPANVKVTPEGRVKVLDFGLAKAFEGDGEADLSRALTLTVGTEDGRILGTPAYMSPEQARGKPVDKRTDIWAFGCVLYEMLTGERAFRGETVQDTIAAVLEREPDWQALPQNLLPAIRRLLRRCLEKDRTERLHDIADARIELREAVAGDGIDLAFPASPARRKTRGWRKLPMAAIGALATAAVLFAMAFRIHRPTPPAPGWTTAQSVVTQLTNYGGTEAAPALSPDGKSFVFVSEHGGTPDIWLRQVSGGEPVRLTNDASEEADLAYSPDGEAIYYTRIDEGGAAIWRIGALGGQARKVLSDAQRPAPSPDGRSLAYYERQPDGSYALSASALDGSGKRTLARDITAGGGGLIRAAWSPDGRWLSYRRSGLFAPSNLFVIDVRTGQERQVTHFTRSIEGVFQHAWLPDNRHLVVSYVPSSRQQAPSDLGILDVQDGSIMRMTMAVGDSLGVQNISADGSRLIATALQHRNEVWKVPFGPDPDANGRAAVRLLDSTWSPLWTYVSRDGRTLLFNSPASGSRNLWLMPLDGKVAPRQITAMGGDVIAHSSLSPDGLRVAFASNTTGDSQVWTQKVDGSELRQITNDGGADSWPVWSPDGRWIVFASDGGREIRRVLATGGTEEKISDGSFRGDWFPQPDGAGTWLTSITGSGGVRLLDLEHQILLWERKKPFGNALPMFSPDGKLISAFAADNVIWVFETATGKSRLAAKLPFPANFRADWTDNGKAFVVNRQDSVSHIVLFDRFWVNQRGQKR
jgi:Tol biopolymer transport system component